MAMTRRQFLGSTAAFSLSAQRPAKPNIVLILADDLGYGDLGCYGQKQIATPNLDRLAAEGIRFTQAYAGSTVCAPSRCVLMTGLHTGHAYVRGNQYPDLPLRPQDLTLTEILKKGGYHTALYGKWSLGGLSTTGYPTRRGFDEWFGYFSQTQAHDYYPYLLLEGEREYLVRGNFGARKTVWVHDLFTERALEFIRRRRQPFFLHLCWTIPHANNEVGRDTGNGMEVPSDAPYSDRSWPQPEKNFAAMITRMDADVGKIMAALRETGQEENTIVIFTSDNGPHREGGHDPDFFDSNGPLRGIKRDLYEGGIRVPMIVRWPARIKPRPGQRPSVGILGPVADAGRSRGPAGPLGARWYFDASRLAGQAPAQSRIPLLGVSRGRIQAGRAHGRLERGCGLRPASPSSSTISAPTWARRATWRPSIPTWWLAWRRSWPARAPSRPNSPCVPAAARRRA
jgi:hypothetical protein